MTQLPKYNVFAPPNSPENPLLHCRDSLLIYTTLQQCSSNLVAS